MMAGFLDAWRLAGAIVVGPVVLIFRVIWTFIRQGHRDGGQTRHEQAHLR